MAVIVITDQTTRAELAALLADENYRAKRIPTHHTERKAAAHARIDALLEDYDKATH